MIPEPWPVQLPMPAGPLTDSQADYAVTVDGRPIDLFASRTCAMLWPFRYRMPEEVAAAGPGPAKCGPSGNSPYTFGWGPPRRWPAAGSRHRSSASRRARIR